MSLTLSHQVLNKYPNNIFVETGTYQGGGIVRALEAGFFTIHSVESDKGLYENARRRFLGHAGRVFVHHGGSVQVLPSILERIKSRATFWLDAHPFYGGHSPLLRELAVIASHPVKEHTIMIDDRRVFKAWGLDERRVIAQLLAINNSYRITYENNRMAPRDIIVAHLRPRQIVLL